MRNEYNSKKTQERSLEAIAQCSTWELEFKLGNNTYINFDVIFYGLTEIIFE